MLDNLPLKLLI